MPRQSTSFFTKKEFAKSAGFSAGLVTASFTTGAMTTAGTAVLSAPLWIGAILGLLPAQIASAHLSAKYDRILRQSPNLNAFCQFTIRATTTALGMLIGIATASMVVGLTINPFTLPALITGGVCAGIIFGLYLYANSKKSHRYERIDPIPHTHDQDSSAAGIVRLAWARDAKAGNTADNYDNGVQISHLSSLAQSSRYKSGTRAASASAKPVWLHNNDNSDSDDENKLRL
ncbi:MAG: hypothetical protein NXI01_03250 [Gammaproteobacteria bacterium]|nr:hypothetical protein [Gammaproteobacteria bacterium]